jgi:hypothetical protein
MRNDNNPVFHGRGAHKTLFNIHLHRGSLDAFCSPPRNGGLALASAFRVDVAHLTQLTVTLSSAYPYN